MVPLNLAQRQFQEFSKTASVKICTEENHLLGTGFFVLPNQILTCYHVIENQEKIQLFLNQENIVNSLGNEIIKGIHEVPDKDLALIELKENIFAPNQFCLKLSERVEMNNDCYSFGFSKELYNGDTIITKYVDKVGDSKEWIKLKDDRIINGFSGSGLINLRNGHVVGVISESLSTSLNLGGLAIPTEIIFKAFPELKNKQENFYEQQLHFKNIYKRLLFDYETIEGVDIIDDLFIEFHRHQKNTTYTPRDFYLATPIAQWWGIINNLTVDKKVFPKIISFITENFNHPAPIISLLHGSGGMGKSTTARKLLYYFKNQYQCIWIDDLLEEEDGENFFNNFLPNLLSDNKKTLIVLDDWGKLTNAIKGKFKRLFKKNHKKSITNLKFVITGRQQHIKDILLEWQVPNAKTYFNVPEELQVDNKKLLDKFLESFPIEQESFLSAKNQLIRLKPFHLLFTLIRANENKSIQEELSKKKWYGNYFQDIINFDLNELYKDEHRRGFVYALIFSAYLSYQHNYNISKSTFLQIADKYNNAPYSLLKNKKNSPAHNWEVLRFYISENISEKNKRANAPEQIQFNKDDFKEAILKADLEHCFQSALEFFDEWKSEAIDEVVNNGSEYSSSIAGLIFGGLEKVIDKEKVIENLLKRNNSHHAYTKLFLDSRFCNIDFNKKWKYVNSFLSINVDNGWANAFISSIIQKEFRKNINKQNALFKSLIERGANDERFVIGYLKTISEPETAIEEAKVLIKNSDSHYSVISTCLRILEAEPETAIEEAKVLIKNSDSHYSVISTCLRVLEAEPETAIKEAKDLIQKSDSFEVICNCLKILEAEPEIAIKEAKDLIQKSDSPQVICNCLRILEAEPETAIKEAKDLIQKSDSFEVICNCLKILEAEPEIAIKEAKDLIQKSDSPQVICNCLRILEGEPETAIKEAKDLIQKSDSFEVICNCLKILEGEPETAIKEAKVLIKNSDSHHSVICNCLRILEAEPEGQAYAKEILKNWQKENQSVVIWSLNAIPNSEEAKLIVHQLLSGSVNNYYLYSKVIQYGYGNFPIWEKRVNSILKNWKRYPRNLVANCLNHYEDDLRFTMPICKGLLSEWKNSISKIKRKRPKQPNYYFIFKAMAHPDLKEFVKRICIEMLNDEEVNAGFLPKHIKERCELIICHNDYPEWVNEENSDSNKI